MGDLGSNPAGPDASGERPVGREPASKGHWLWIIALAAIVAVGFWYFRGSHASTEAQGPAAPGGSGKGQGRGAGAGGVVVAGVGPPGPGGGLPVYFNGIGTVKAFKYVDGDRHGGGPNNKNTLPGRRIR